MSTIQLTKQLPLEEIITAVKHFKRNGEKISDLIRANNMTAAMALLKQQESTAAQIQTMLSRCQDTYLSPETAKKVMMVKRQFKQERTRIAQDVHSARQNMQQKSANNQHQQEQEIQGFDFDIENRLIREKGESLTKVNQKIITIQSVMRQAQSLTFQQGQKLDLVSDNLEKTVANTTKANEHLQQANKYSKQHNKCCLWLVVLILVAVCVILIIVLVVCFLLTHLQFILAWSCRFLSAVFIFYWTQRSCAEIVSIQLLLLSI